MRKVRLELTPHFWDQLLRLACLPFHHFRIVRRGRDSNPGTPYEVFSFQDWRNRPLCHLSIKKMLSIQAAITLVTLSQHNNVINLLWYLSDLSKNFYANLQINIVKSKFFLVLGVNYTDLKEGAWAKGDTLWHGTLTNALTELWYDHFSLHLLQFLSALNRMSENHTSTT